MELVLIVLAIFVPPLAVFLTCGICKHFWINIVLTLLGYIPGMVHAVWYIARRNAHA
ncbi:MAG: YqaE/Pmp3 family membrane protein [Pseudomonadota bacterium]